MCWHVHLSFNKLQSPLGITGTMHITFVLTINDNKFACKFFWNMNVRVPVLHRFDIIGLGPDSPEDEEGIKASSEICKLSCIFKSEGFVERY